MDLEDTMASLELNDRALEDAHSSGDVFPVEEVEDEAEEKEESLPRRRSARLRSRIHPLPVEKRRVLTKPIKIPKDGKLSIVENYYLDKRVKRLHPSLETIYEESRQIRNEEVYMGSRKIQRRINFSTAAVKNGGKVRKRKLKTKRLPASARGSNEKITLKYLMDKLSNIKDEH